MVHICLFNEFFALGKILRYNISTLAGPSKKAGRWFADSVSQNISASLLERPVRYPNEIYYAGARETDRAFILTASSPPFMVKRLEYHKQWKDEKIYDGADQSGA